jgi:hypothetical protein
VDPLQIHESTGGRLAPRQGLRQRVFCAALLLAAAASLAQEPPGGLQPQVAAGNPPAAVLATVLGVVRNAATGQPLPRALVRIEGEADTGALTDGEGRFEIPGVPVGPQTIQVRKPGFHDRPYASEDVDYQDDGPAHSVLVAAEMPELEFKLSPASAIHGRIELSTGDPAQGIIVTLLKQVVRNGRAVWAQNGTTQTNGNGAYRFGGLPGGVYALFTQPAMESEPAVTAVAANRVASVARQGYASIFYPEAREFSDATRIRLRAGEQTEANMLLTLEYFYNVAATEISSNGKDLGGNAPPGGPSDSQSQMVLVLDAAGRPEAYTGRFDATTHTAQASLPDGTYTLFVSVSSNELTTVQIDPGGEAARRRSASSGISEFSVDGHPVTNLQIPLAPVSRWPIHLRTVRTAAQAGASSRQGLGNQVMVTATSAGDAPVGFNTDAIAERSGPDLLEIAPNPGPHWISTEVFDRSLCVDSFTAGGINLAREPLKVPLGSSPPPMELTLRDDCAKLTLELPPALSAFLPGDEPFYTVYVVPDLDTTADIPPMNMHPSSGATLTVDGLAPGSYHVYVFDRPVRLEYRNPAVLAALPTPGQQVTLSAGTTSGLMLEVPER